MSSLPGALRLSRDRGLHRLNAVEALVDVHRVQQRLVEAGLVLLGDDQHLVLLGREFLRQLGFANAAVHADFGVLPVVEVGVDDLA